MYPVSRISPGLAVCPSIGRFHDNGNGYRDLVAVTFLPYVCAYMEALRGISLSVSRNVRTKRTYNRSHRSFHRHFDAFVCLPALSLCVPLVEKRNYFARYRAVLSRFREKRFIIARNEARGNR